MPKNRHEVVTEKAVKVVMNWADPKLTEPPPLTTKLSSLVPHFSRPQKKRLLGKLDREFAPLRLNLTTDDIDNNTTIASLITLIENNATLPLKNVSQQSLTSVRRTYI